MEVFNHDLENLFKQLGLAADSQAINTFIANHHLSDDESLAQAAFWSPSQRQFLEEAMHQDADWAEHIDILDTLLRKGRS
ncbi:DUF2789 domain-containing protein [Enterovibrio paralichthyis]|uniref:DUF2789 domain-containing protein n=1 Tax=Enterovibrio paralichthyis TaxID=2853805 RepID=UPI001C48604D|nr:DUF2789 domain-containing protein [Enterovibrio paralichthyis]MBV7300061.1 DUF2789 domain-containing protein [Enterovibrio paralichthyis]